MEASVEATVLAALERAEIAARERRLAASAEAERIVAAGRERALAAGALAEARVAEALDALRTEARSEADQAIDKLERAVGDRSHGRTSPTDADPAFGRAVELVVALILGEHDGNSGPQTESEDGAG